MKRMINQKEWKTIKTPSSEKNTVEQKIKIPTKKLAKSKKRDLDRAWIKNTKLSISQSTGKDTTGLNQVPTAESRVNKTVMVASNPAPSKTIAIKVCETKNAKTLMSEKCPGYRKYYRT